MTSKEIHHYLAQALYELYQSSQDEAKETAIKLAQKWVQFFPENPVAAHVYAAFQGRELEGSADEYVCELFDSFSESFEAALKKVNYRIPELLAEEMKNQPLGLRILDAGCGTGLNAETLKPYASVLTGVDLSEKMLARAKDKNVYDFLEKGNLVNFCEERPDAFDFVVLSDVACYFGGLEKLLHAVNTALADGGGVFLTVEKSDLDKDYVLRPSGRFAHSAEYLDKTLCLTGFEKKRMSFSVLREENGIKVDGIIVFAQKTNEKANSKLDNDDKKD